MISILKPDGNYEYVFPSSIVSISTVSPNHHGVACQVNTVDGKKIASSEYAEDIIKKLEAANESNP